MLTTETAAPTKPPLKMKGPNPYQQAENDLESLVLSHLGLVKRIALHLRPRLSSFMDLDELIQVGTIGLIEAARSFVAAKGVPFEHFAHSRVRGAIIDEVRRMSNLPRSAVAINKQHSEEVRQLSSVLGREPSQAEVFRIPLTALLEGRSVMRLVPSNDQFLVEPTAVNVLEATESYALVEGLLKGDSIVAVGAHLLSSGQKVRRLTP